MPLLAPGFPPWIPKGSTRIRLKMALTVTSSATMVNTRSIPRPPRFSPGPPESSSSR